LEEYEKINNKNEIVSIWFDFPLNKTQSVVLLVLSSLGVISLPLLIFENILYYILYYNKLMDFYGLIHIIFYSACFMLSLYTFLKVIKGTKIQDKQKEVLESRITHVLWFGIHLTYNQALVLFALSLSGILFTSYYSIMLMFDYAQPLYIGFTYLYLEIHFINIALLIICIFTISRIKKSQIKSEDVKELNKFSLILFTLSIVLFISLIYPTLFLFYTSMLIINSIIIYQTFYFIGVLILIALIICISLLVLSALNLKRKYNFSLKLKKSSRISQKQKWFGIIKINPVLALIFLSFSIFVVIYLLFNLSFEIFIVKSIGIDTSTYFFYVILLLIPCFYTIDFILKKNRLELLLESYYGEKFPKNKWFGLKVNKSQSAIIFWLSLSSVGYLIYLIIIFFINLPVALNYIEQYPEIFDSRYLIRNSIEICAQCLMVIIYLYSMIVTRKFRNSLNKEKKS